MKKIVPAVLLLFFFSSFFKGNNCPAISCDGIYVYKLDAESSAVIRFYPDGIVLVSTSVNDYSKVLTWFNRDPENYSRVLTGKYKVSGSCAVKFNVKGETGEQRYSGTIQDSKTLQLHVFNPKEKTSTDRAYSFVKP